MRRVAGDGGMGVGALSGVRFLPQVQGPRREAVGNVE